VYGRMVGARNVGYSGLVPGLVGACWVQRTCIRLVRLGRLICTRSLPNFSLGLRDSGQRESWELNVPSSRVASHPPASYRHIARALAMGNVPERWYRPGHQSSYQVQVLYKYCTSKVERYLRRGSPKKKQKYKPSCSTTVTPKGELRTFSLSNISFV
jgi:hypothetical protein